MEASRIYQQLEELYTRREAKSDSFTISTQLEGLVGTLLKDIVRPFGLTHQPRIAEYAFDWSAELDGSAVAFFELMVGDLSQSRIRRILDVAASLTSVYSATTVFLVSIGRNIAPSEHELLESKQERLRSLAAHFTFMDYRSLIKIHRIISTEENLRFDSKSLLHSNYKRFKRSYLTYLFANPVIDADRLDYLTRDFLSTLSMFQESHTRSRVSRTKGSTRIEEQLSVIQSKLDQLMTDVRKLKSQISETKTSE